MSIMLSFAAGAFVIAVACALWQCHEDGIL